ncbi:MAG: hypothetical protein J07HQX50_02471 [Haloquadratum sp. J07HQX50]|nr:MAG: hypothetical protein J07HQX50_02471 [Haloquadratum sp. J07HQX50]
MSFADTDIQSLGQSPLVHGLLWFVVISVCGYLFTDRSLFSALSTATVSAVFDGGLVYLWNVY